MAKIEVKGLYKSYGGAEILKDINLKVEQGEVLALIGPTGSGKTTLLRLIGLLEMPTIGEIIFDGLEVTGLTERERLKARRRMAMVFQKPVMFKTSVRENVSYGLKIRGEGRINEQVEAAIKAVGLSGYESRDANTLSGGEMQRIALARALVLDPELLLLDEPTANLDPKTAASIDALISRFEGTVIMATHNMLQARKLADRVAVLIEGRLAEVGRPKEVLGKDGSLDLQGDAYTLPEASAPW
ncbi:MAG TPA: phosphate ABC transporter ATP-binding protein [Methanotrichaceae archaeon]|nr:phosphate ABC transporter ATP-binding protein [Methanotrichaceae archaeon]